MVGHRDRPPADQDGDQHAERRTWLSLLGGERQQIAIARILLRNRPVLILDEATGAVDNRTERPVHEALDDLARGHTMIAIAHLLSTVRTADQIVVRPDNAPMPGPAHTVRPAAPAADNHNRQQETHALNPDPSAHQTSNQPRRLWQSPVS